jgi:hypothetical protein
MAQKTPKVPYPKLAALRLGHAATPTNALLNLLRRDINQPTGDSTKPNVDINRFTMDKVSRQTSQDITDSNAVMQLLPELQLVKTVAVGTTLDPKSMSEANLTFSVDPTVFDSEIGKLLLEPIENFFKKDYKIDDRLDLIIEDCLFNKGSSVLCVLPENVLDNLVNGRREVSMEAFSTIRDRIANSSHDNMGFLGSPKTSTDGRKISLEGFSSDVHDNTMQGMYNDTLVRLDHIKVSDNFNVLKVPGMSKRVRELGIAAKLRRNQVSMEAEVHQFNNTEIEKLYENTRAGSEQTQVISSPKYMARPSVGHPLILPLPPESVIPVFVAGRPHEHIGYFLLVDHHGYPVSKDSTRDFYGELQAGWKNGGSGGAGGLGNSEILRLTREAMGDNDNKSAYEVDHIQQAFNAILTSDLNNRLRNGLYDQDVEMGITQEIQRIMLFRSWKAKTTQLIFVPEELMTYIAFDYNANGIGETLIARTKMLSTMRTTLLFAETIGGMRNAMGRKKVRVEIDPDDPDPEQTVSNIQSVIIEQGHRSFPLAAPDPAQTMDALIRSGYDFEINANDSAYAQTKVEFDDYNTNVNAGNPELQDRLRRYHISSFGIPPEKVDPMASPDFATSIVNNDLVSSRVVKERQKALCAHLTKFVRCFAMHSSIIREEMYRLIEANVQMLVSPELKKMSVSEVVDEFILAMMVALPAPDNTQHERQLESIEAYERLLDKGLEAYITPDLFPDDVTEISGLADDVLVNIKALFIRQFMASNNILPELNVLTEMDGTRPAFSLLDHINVSRATQVQAFIEYAAGKKKFSDRIKEIYKEVIDNIQNDSDGGGFDSGGGDDFSSDDDSGGDDFGGGFGDDTGVGEEPGLDDGTQSELDSDFDMGSTDQQSEGTDTQEEDESDFDAGGLDDPMGAAEKDELGDEEEEEKP